MSAETRGCALTEDKATKENTVHVRTDPKFEDWATVRGFCPNALPHPSTWSSRPLLFRLSGDVHKIPKESLRPAWRRFEENAESDYLKLNATGESEMAQACLPVNTMSFNFDTKLFTGKGMLRLPSKETAAYFEGKQRKSSMLIQGRFKRKISYRDIYTGQEFCHPVKSPGYLITKAAFAFFKAISPSLEANIAPESEKKKIPNSTHFMSPLAGTASVIQITEEKDAPTLSSTLRITEDLTLAGGIFKDSLKEKPDMAKRISWRRKYFQKIKHLEQYSFDPDLVYTFDFYNDKLLMDSLELSILGSKYDLTKYLAGQPLRIMAKSRDGMDYLWNFELWHERQTEAWEETKADKIVLKTVGAT